MESIGAKLLGRGDVRLRILIGVALLFGCEREASSSVKPLPVVSVVSVQAKDLPVIFEYLGQTQSSHLVNIQARVSGFLDKRVYKEGDRVLAGDVLYEMDPKPFQAQVDAARAAVDRQKAAAKTAGLNLDRTKPLVRLNALSQKDLDDAVGSFETSNASVAQSEAQLETAELNLSYCTIRSPLDGITSASLQQEGTYINTANSKLTTVSQLSPIWVNFALSENEILNYQKQVLNHTLHPPKDEQYEVEVILVDGSIFPNKGKITFAEPYFNPQTGTFLIRATLENPEGVLRPNQYVKVKVTGAIRPNAITVPQEAVQQSSKGPFVWIVDQKNEVSYRPVVLGDWQGDKWLIKEGLTEGMQVIVDGTMGLSAGEEVRIK